VTESSRPTRVAEAGAILAVGLGVPWLVLSTPLFLPPILSAPLSGVLLFVGVLASFALAYRWGLHRDRNFLAVWFGVGLAIAAFSVATGFWNGLTDEPYGTPAFIRLLPNLYGSPLHLTYSQYGAGPLSLTSYYVYLPLLAFLQVPGLDYRWVTVGAWLLTLWFVRKQGASVTLLAAPWVALLAANGFNDFLPIAALTASIVALAGARSKLAEILALGMKQFANVIDVVWHLWNRRWRDALLAVGVTAAFLLPFAYLSPSGVWCHAILLSPKACSGSSGFTSGAAAISHLNYFLWPIWILAIFGVRYVASLRTPANAPVRAEATSAVVAVRRTSSTSPPSEAWVLLAAPYVQLRTAVRSLHPELWTIGKYLTVGGTGVIVNLLVFSAARNALGPAALLALVASTIAFGVATVWNFTWNYEWTFRDQHSRPALHHGVGFAAASLAALAMNLVVLYFLVGHLSALVAQFLGILAGTAVGFALNRGLNFSAPRATAGR
jgi:putative flippase GtrA